MTSPFLDTCCDQFEQASRLGRRRFLAGAAAAGAASLTTSVFGDALRQTAYGSEPGGNVLVVISLRGGVDGLGMVVPHGDPQYYAARPNIALPRASLLAKDSMFGLHPKMAPLEWLFTSGEMAAVHAVGLPVPNRSHFAAIEEIEDADPASTLRQGWVNRMIGLNDRDTPCESIQMGLSVVPTMLNGPSPGVATTALKSMGFPGMESADKWATYRRDQLDLLWGSEPPSPLIDAFKTASRAIDTLAPVGAATYSPAVAYPRVNPAAGFSDALKDTAQLIKADIGAEVISIDYGTWDMHADYGDADHGNMQAMVAGFASTLSAFMKDLGPALRQRVTVVTISEFGRRIQQNGNLGLDHGWGNMMLVAGAGVKGGSYYGSWPGLGTVQNPDADLQVTTDYRNVFGEVLARRFPDRSLATVFPGLGYAPLGLMN